MAAGGRDGQRADDVDVAVDVGEVGVRPGRRERREARLGRWRPVTAAQDLGDLGERARPDDVEPVDERRLGGTLARDDEPLEPLAHGALGDGEDAAAGPQLSAERELTEDREALERAGGDLAARRQDAGGDREVEPGPRLAQVRGREVDGEASRGELEARVEDRRVDALARLTDGAVAEPDDREVRQAGADVDLDGDEPRVESRDGEGGDVGEHGRQARGGRVTAKPRICTNSAQLLRRNRVISAPLRRGCRSAASRHWICAELVQTRGPLSHLDP